MLKVVEHQQKLAVAQGNPYHVVQRLPRSRVDFQHPSDLRHHHRAARDRSQRHHPHPVAVTGDRLAGDLDCQPCLPRAPSAKQRQQPYLRARQQLERALHLGSSPDNRVRRGGQIRTVERAQRRKIALQTGDQQLKQVLRRRQVLEPVIAKVTARHDLPEHAPGLLCDKHLPAVRDRHHPRCPMNIDPQEVPVAGGRSTRVDAHAHLRRPPIGPVTARQRNLGTLRAADRLLSADEHCEERIPSGADLTTTRCSNRLPHQPIMLPQQVRIPLAQRIQ